MSNEPTNQPSPPEHYVGAPPPPPPRMSFLDKIVGILTEPRAFFTNLRAHPEWLTPFLTIGIVMAALTAISLPKAIQISHIAMQEAAAKSGQPMPDIAYKIADGFTYSAPVLVFAGLLFGWLIASAIIFLITLMTGASPDFKLLWTIVAWAGFPTVFQQIMKTVYLLTLKDMPTTMAGVKQLQGFSLSLGQLMPPDTVAAKLTQPIDLFTIWGLILLYEGLVHMLKMNRKQAGIVAIVYAVVGYAIVDALVFVGQRAGGG
jgi:hypothetical protein